MKKIKKATAILSSAIMAMLMGIMSVSAGIAGESNYIGYYYDYCGVENENVPISVSETLYYKGIVVTMPEGVVPTVETIGFDCEISEYTEGYNAVCGTNGVDLESGKLGWIIEDTTKTGKNKYFLDVDEILSEDEAVDFSKKLVIRGLVNEAEVSYKHTVNNGYIHWLDSKYVRMNLSFKNEVDVENFDASKFPEIEESGFSIYNYYSSANNLYIYAEPTMGYNDLIELYENILELDEKLTAKYSEIEYLEPLFTYPVLDSSKEVGYSIVPLWGDATNDDKINLYDAIEISKYMLGKADLDEDTVLLSDITRDGKTDLYDVIEVAKILLKK